MAEQMGLEPMTPGLTGQRSTN